MILGIVGQAAGLFAVTNIDDIVLLAIFFAQTAGRREALQVVAGQYVGFVGILAVAVAAAFGATFLPGSVLPFLGLLPLALGIKAAWQAWRERGEGGGEEDSRTRAPGAWEVAAVTFANGGDNIGVYVPVFANSGGGLADMAVYAVVFLVLVGVWCLAGRFFATRPVVAKVLSRWGHVLLPVVLIALGIVILLDAF